MVKRKPSTAPTLIVREGRSAVLSVAELHHHPKNARQGDIGAIVDSIETNGWYGELIVQEGTNVVVAGNHRLEAARALGMDTVPVRFYPFTDEEAERILLADNRTADLAAYDDTRLAELLADLAETDLGLAGTGWDGDDFDALLHQLGAQTSVGTTNEVKTPADRLADYEAAGIRSIILPMSIEDYERLVAGFGKLRSHFGVDSNTEVVARLVSEAVEGL